MVNTSTNLPSTASNQGRRGNIAGEENRMDRDMEEMILDERLDENANLKDEDLEELQNHGEKWCE